jgi:two-component system phosphate regulon sensor histidine kinase PhoR
LDARGKVLRDTLPASLGAVESAVSPELEQARRTGSEGWAERYVSGMEGRQLVFALPVTGDGQILGFVRIATPLQGLPQALDSWWLVVLGVNLVLFLALATAAWFSARRFSRSLSALVANSGSFARGEAYSKLFVPKPAELRTLSVGLNSLYSRLEERLTNIGRQKDELLAILTSMVEGVIVLDKALVIGTMNPAARRLFPTARSPEGQSLIEVARNSALDDLARSLTSRPEETQRAELLMSDLQTTLQVQGAPLLGPSGQVWGVVLVMSDITQLKRLEVMRRDFVANVSHELKTPLTTIQGFAETLLDGALQDQQRASEFLSVIAKQADRLALIVDDLLILTRLENSPPQAGELREVDLGELAATVVAAFSARARELKVKLQLETHPSSRLWVFPLLLEQALGNLLDNALKFSPAGSRVTLEIRSDVESVWIEVRDTGPGISEADQQRVFERFYRAEATRATTGTGLGLAIVKHILLIHRGTVTLSSPPSGQRKGTSFVLKLPYTGDAGR